MSERLSVRNKQTNLAWVVEWPVPVGQDAARQGMSRLVMLGQGTTLVIGTAAPSTVRSGIELGSGMASLVEMRRDMTWSVLAVFVMETTCTVGVVAASMLLGGIVF